MLLEDNSAVDKLCTLYLQQTTFTDDPLSKRPPYSDPFRTMEGMLSFLRLNDTSKFDLHDNDDSSVSQRCQSLFADYWKDHDRFPLTVRCRQADPR